MVFHFLIPLILTSMAPSIATDDIDYSLHFTGVTYKNIKNDTEFRGDCREYDSCKSERFSDTTRYNCICGDVCTQQDTCCIDSEFRDKQIEDKKRLKCVARYGPYPRHYFMVDSCDPSWTGDNSTEDLCKGDPEKMNNLFLALPVTNPKTGVTFRNYFCASCNNDTDDDQLLFWDMWLGSDLREFDDISLPDVHFYPNRNKWVFTMKNRRKGSVYTTIVPKREWDFIHACIPNVISECAEDWNDTSIQDKCSAYMGVVFYRPKTDGMKTYRNEHCAKCNHENVEEHWCSYFPRPWGFDFGINGIFQKPLSIFAKTKMCEESMFYDTIAKECRIVNKNE